MLFLLGLAPFGLLTPVPAHAQNNHAGLMSSDDYVGITPGASWKISGAIGSVDWSPIDNTFLIVDESSPGPVKIIVYGANGSAIFTSENISQPGDFISPARFSPDGSEIGYYHHPFYNNTSELDTINIKTGTHNVVRFQGNIYGFDWMRGTNSIIYATGELGANQSGYSRPAIYRLVSHDLQTGSEAIVVPSIPSVEGLTLSPSGRDIAFIQTVHVDHPCTEGEYSNCSNNQLVIAPVISNSSQVQSRVVAQVTSPNGISSPRWLPDNSRLIYSTGFMCSSLEEVASDGSANKTIITWGQPASANGCYGDASLNKDGSMLIYGINYGGVPFDNTFNPVNAGTYLSLTNLCRANCAAPAKTIPILPPEQVSGMSISTISQNASYIAYMKAGYQQGGIALLDPNSKKLTFQLSNPVEGVNKERYIKLYLQSQLLDGNMTISINGTRFYPPLAENNSQCLNNHSNEFCSRIKASVDKIEGWSIVNIADDTTEQRSSVVVEILGTTAIPEFGSGFMLLTVTAAIGAIISLGLAARRKELRFR